MYCLFIPVDIVWFGLFSLTLYTHTNTVLDGSSGMWKGALKRIEFCCCCCCCCGMHLEASRRYGRQKDSKDGKYHKIEYPNKEFEVQFIIMWTHFEGANYNERKKRSFGRDSTQWIGVLVVSFSLCVPLFYLVLEVQFMCMFAFDSVRNSWKVLAHEPNSDRCNFHHSDGFFLLVQISHNWNHSLIHCGFAYCKWIGFISFDREL